MAALSLTNFAIPAFAPFLALPLLVLSADPDPLQDFCVADLQARPSMNGFPCQPAANVTGKEFFFDGFLHAGISTAWGARLTAANVLSFPALNTLGISMNQVVLNPKSGLYAPHVHPRATELGLVAEGNNVLVGFVTTAGVYYSRKLGAGEAFVVPRGLVHFQLNLGSGKAVLYTTFNSQLPGALVLSAALFNSTPSIENRVLAEAFLVDEDIVKTIKKAFHKIKT